MFLAIVGSVCCGISLKLDDIYSSAAVALSLIGPSISLLSTRDLQKGPVVCRYILWISGALEIAVETSTLSLIFAIFVVLATTVLSSESSTLQV